MSASKAPLLRLRHIRDELDWILPTFHDVSFESFAADIVQIRAAERGLLIISEAAKALPIDMLESYPQIEWHAVRSIGNLLRHEYERVEPRTLWRTVTVSLPRLSVVIDKMLADQAG
jgi:uncharacterized protein with HEPN domain